MVFPLTDIHRTAASTPKPNFELSHLPPLLARSPWTIYLDDVPDLDTQGRTCTEKYLGSNFSSSEIAILNVRPDGYVGSVRKWDLTATAAATDEGGAGAAEQVGRQAAAWLDDYFGGFLAVPP